jgi:uncharacterized protein (UPF0332 family)
MYYVKENKVDKCLSKTYGRLFNLRQSGDYEDWAIIDEEDVQPFLEPAEKFIAEMERLIKS